MIKSFLLLICSVSVSLAATVNVVPSGGNSYSVTGGSMDGVAGIELNISYDSSSLASPSVNQGGLVSGAMFLANANIPGNIKVAIISTTPFKGSGQIATISFGSQTGSGGVTGLTASLIDINGKPISAQTSVTSASSNQAGTSTESPAGSTTSSASTSTGGTTTTQAAAASGFSSALGTVSMSSDNQTGTPAPVSAAPVASKSEVAAVSPEVAKTVDPPVAAGEAAIAAAEPAAVQAVYGAIAERFRVYQGVRTPAAMMNLFQKPVSGIISQDPAIVVSDGKAKLRLIVDLPSGSSTAPNFAMSGAKMSSLKSGDAPGRWIVEAVPNKNVVKASVTILQGGSVLEYQLTVVPPTTAISGKEADFADFLKDSGSKVPRFDLNADGKHDYLDDYIYTAHYLVLKSGGRK